MKIGPMNIFKMNKEKMATVLIEAKKIKPSNNGLKYYMNKQNYEDVLKWAKEEIKDVIIYQPPTKD